MYYFSTRDKTDKVTAAKAIACGLAPDGGLYVPEAIPELTADELKSLCKSDYRSRAVAVMSKYLDDFSEAELWEFAVKAYGANYDDPDCAAPLRGYDSNTAFLELWHGPTCAFKDMALQILPYLLTASIKKCGETNEICILVATSGDTGKAAMDGFADVPGTKIVVFYPNDGVSDIQKLQMTTQSGKNVLVSGIVGNFDDAQTGVKEIFNDTAFAGELEARGHKLSSANSMNWGRLLPQIVYYVSAYCDAANTGLIEFGEKLNFCVPTGNFGNIIAGWFAKQMGVPMGKLICASNKNNVLSDFISKGVYNKNREFFTTISPSMDILVSSNLERLLYELCGDDSLVKSYMSQLSEKGEYKIPAELREKLSNDFTGGFCDDISTKSEIKRVFDESGYLIDTHTAVASKVLTDYRALTGDDTPCVVVSTASPYKFAEDVLSALGGSGKGTEALELLKNVSETVIPKPLQKLAREKQRFDGCIDKVDMKEFVKGYLK